MKTERYEHHGTEVSVISDLKGRHRENCLCYGCEKFNPGAPNHCRIAKRIYDTCVQESVVTPVYECPEFEASTPERRASFLGA